MEGASRGAGGCRRRTAVDSGEGAAAHAKMGLNCLLKPFSGAHSRTRDDPCQEEILSGQGAVIVLRPARAPTRRAAGRGIHAAQARHARRCRPARRAVHQRRVDDPQRQAGLPALRRRPCPGQRGRRRTRLPAERRRPRPANRQDPHHRVHLRCRRHHPFRERLDPRSTGRRPEIGACRTRAGDWRRTGARVRGDRGRARPSGRRHNLRRHARPRTVRARDPVNHASRHAQRHGQQAPRFGAPRRTRRRCLSGQTPH